MGGAYYRSRHLDRMFFAISKERFVYPNMYMSIRRELGNSTREPGNFTVELRGFVITYHPILKSIYNGLNLVCMFMFPGRSNYFLTEALSN